MENTELKQTALHQRHLDLNAKMSPFAGFDMPILYSDIVTEHNAVRNSVGVFDVSHMGEIFVSGKDAEKFVNYIFTNDISTLQSGQILYGMLLYENGGTVDDLLVYKTFEENTYLLVVNAANIDKDYAWIKENSKGFDVIVDNQSEKWGQIAVQGPKSEDMLYKLFSLEEFKTLKFYTFADIVFEGERLILSRTGYTGEDGFEIYASNELIQKLWDRLIDAGVAPCGLGCRDTLRFEAGLPLYGDELSPSISPVMAGLTMFCKLEKDFIGRDALVKQKESGDFQKVVGLELEDKAIPRATYPVELEDGTQIGVVTTGYRSISLDKSLAFALVEKDYSKLGTQLFVRVRKRVFPAIVVKKRFYQPNYNK